jgi:hypothetical protein
MDMAKHGRCVDGMKIFFKPQFLTTFLILNSALPSPNCTQQQTSASMIFQPTTSGMRRSDVLVRKNPIMNQARGSVVRTLPARAADFA